MEIKETLTQTKKTSFTFAKQLGLKSLKQYLFTWLSFGLLNIICCIIIIFILPASESILKYILSFLAILIIGIIFLVTALYFTHKYIIIYAVKMMYDLLVPFFQKLCTSIIEFARNNNKPIDSVVNSGEFLNNIYQDNAPSYAKKGIKFIIKRIPFSSILNNMGDVVKTTDKEKASAMLFDQVNTYIHDTIFIGNNLKSVYILFIINVIVQIIIMYILAV